ncbi:MAG: acyltransferase [Lachnospiraceae bacterium]|nr:acyltransferase [Robinsoniella sp.]MDY3765840.1 acyltransferase [Lachnospiraceae bacterium]
MNTSRFDQLDGLRAFAIFLVVASHTSAFGLKGQGGIGVAIFFVLSGFLLVLPGQQDGEERFCSPSSVFSFYLRRILRLLPTYYLVIFTVYWLTDSHENLLGNLFFFNCQGHLWYLQQELLFCAIAPFLMMLLHFLKTKGKFNNLAVFFFLLILACLSQRYLSADVFSLSRHGARQPFRLALFLVGMAFGYLYKYGTFSAIRTTLGRHAADVVCLLLLFASIFSAPSFLGKCNPLFSSYYIGWDRPLLCAVASGVFLFLLLANPAGITARIFQIRPFVMIGKVSYGIYLVHFFLISYADFSTPSRVFCAVFFTSLGIAMLLHEWVEKPLQKLCLKLTK